jgi:hypothetical protein
MTANLLALVRYHCSLDAVHIHIVIRRTEPKCFPILGILFYPCDHLYHHELQQQRIASLGQHNGSTGGRHPEVMVWSPLETPARDLSGLDAE